MNSLDSLICNLSPGQLYGRLDHFHYARKGDVTGAAMTNVVAEGEIVLVLHPFSGVDATHRTVKPVALAFDVGEFLG